MLSAKAKPLLLLFFLNSVLALCSPLHELQLGLQATYESSYRDSAGPFFDYSYSPYSFLKTKFCSGLLWSRSEMESITYCSESEFRATSWLSFLVRGSHRSQIRDTFSRTSVFGLGRIRALSGRPISFFASGGWYHRWVYLEQAHLFPGLHPTSFAQNDLVVELGVTLPMSASVDGLLRLATFDTWEVYNLNNPFVESSFLIGDKNKSEKWLATLRYQLLLGFGRLDRLTFGFFYTNRW
ncbi:hypothetical protein EBT16_13525 [bacterium]|nr:hypothetical protein [bacterium]